MSTIDPYEVLPYPCHTYEQTLPGSLAVIARLQGLNAAPANACRVLEIGCGDGSNLLPMAWQHPKSVFHGIDPAAGPLRHGQAFAESLGLKNVRLEALSVGQLLETNERYDYILAHGFYSWVPEHVRKEFLQVCSRALAPEGVVFVSYNAFPGAHIRQMLREIMLFHAGEAPTPEVMIHQARAMAGLLAETISEADDDFAQALASQARRVLTYAPQHLYHDDLSPECRAFYLHEVVADSRRHGLEYLGDADYRTMFELGLPDKIRAILDTLPDMVLRHQYYDFFKARRFRQSLFCHQKAAASARPTLDVLPEFYYAVVKIPPDGLKGPDDEQDGSSQALLARIVRELCKVWPARLSWPELLSLLGEWVDKAASAAAQDSDSFLKELLVEAHAHGMIHLFSDPALCLNRFGPTPKASEYARHQLEFGDSVTNLLHQPLRLNDASGRQLIKLADGSRTLPEIEHAMKDFLAAKSQPCDDVRKLVSEGLNEVAMLCLLQE